VSTDLVIGSGVSASLSNERWRRDAGEPQQLVLFVPGYTGSKEDFLPLLRPLAEAGYYAIAIDQRGQYESAWASSPAGYTIDVLGQDVVEIAQQLKGESARLHLVGHSFGGLVARSATLAKPDLFDTVTLMCSGPAAIGGQRLIAMEQAEPILAQGGMAALWEHMALQSQADPKFRQSPPALLKFLQERFMANDPIGLQVMGDELRSASDRTDELAQLSLPILVLHGADDDAWPPIQQAEMADRLGAAYAVIPHAAHSPAVENPQLTMEVLLNFFRARHG
jgi:pimeloyl-ACP methyl ester carboxylesterase